MYFTLRQVGVDNIDEYETQRLAAIQRRTSSRTKLLDQLSKLKYAIVSERNNLGILLYILI